MILLYIFVALLIALITTLVVLYFYNDKHLRQEIRRLNTRTDYYIATLERKFDKDNKERKTKWTYG